MAKNKAAQADAPETTDDAALASVQPGVVIPPVVDPITVYLTIDVDGFYWWATRDEQGELTSSDGKYEDETATRQRALDVLQREPADVIFVTEEDQRVTGEPS